MVLRLRLYGMTFRLCTYFLPIVAFELGLWLWTFSTRFTARPTTYVPHLSHLLFGVLLWAFLSEQYRVTNFDELFRERTGARNATSACVAISFVVLAVLYFSRNQVFPRGLLIIDVVALFFSAIVLHAFFRIVCRNRAHLSKPIRLLMVGADNFALTAAARLRRLSFAPCDVVGYVRLPNQTASVERERVFDFEQLGTLMSGNSIDEAVIAIPPSEFHRLPSIIETLRTICLPARAIVDLGERVVVKDKLFQLGNMQMLDLTSTPAESLDYALLKRAFDVCFAFTVMLLTLPLLAIIAAIVKLTSSGPILFAQERVGLNGSPFKMYKFRTMCAADESESNVRWTTRSDPRVTPIGMVLRRASLDELPQFWNVLKGDMSVVGPRPERPHFVQKFLQEVTSYNHRHALKVGITGWAQVNGWRGDTSIEKRVEYDLYYLQNWTLLFDFKIIIMTLFSGLIARNAY